MRENHFTPGWGDNSLNFQEYYEEYDDIPDFDLKSDLVALDDVYELEASAPKGKYYTGKFRCQSTQLKQGVNGRFADYHH